MNFVLVLLAFLMSAGTAHAFDCSGVTLPSSIVICSDPGLMRLADERQQAFNDARWGLQPGEDKRLLADQSA